MPYPPGHEVVNQASDKKYREQRHQKLGDSRKTDEEATKAKNSGNYREDKKQDCVA